MKPTRVLLLIFICAFTLRALFIFETYEQIDFRTPSPGLDVDLHWAAASCILDEIDPCFALMQPSAPFFSYYLAISRSLLGDNLVWHRLIMALFGSLAILLLSLIAFRLTKNLIASCIVGILCATLPSLLYFDTMLYKVSLNLFFLSLALWLLLPIVENKNPEQNKGYHWLAGLCLLFAAVNQQSALLWFIPVLASVHLSGQNHPHLRQTRFSIWMFFSLTLIISFLLPFKSPKGHEHFWPQSGIHMRIGFHPGAMGIYNPLPDIPSTPYGHVFYARIQAEDKLRKALSPKEVNRYHLDLALDFIRQNPLKTLKLLLQKTLLFFNHAEIKGVDSLKRLRTTTKLLNIPSIGFAGIFVLGLVGIFALSTKKGWRLLLLLGGILLMVGTANLLTFVTWRYRLPAIVPLAIFAGIGLDFMWREMIQKRCLHSLARCASIMMLGFVITSRPMLPENFERGFLHFAERNSHKRLQAEQMREEIARLNNKPQLLFDERIELIFHYTSIARHSKAFMELEQLGDAMNTSEKAQKRYHFYQRWLGWDPRQDH